MTNRDITALLNDVYDEATGTLTFKGAANSGVDIGDVDVASIAAGSAIIGKVGIDQTTPGTTNVVSQKYTHTYVAAGQATTVIKASAGVLHSITFWAAAAATNVTTIYDNASGAGTIIGLPAATAVTAPVTVILDVAFTFGLTVITGTANGAPMTFAWL